MSDIFHERFTELMDKKGWNQDVGALKFGVSRVSISKYMGKGKDRSLPGYDLLIKIANTFNVSVDYMLGRTDEPFELYKSENGQSLEEEKSLSDFMVQAEMMLHENANIEDAVLKNILRYMKFTFEEKMNEKKNNINT
ncbi:XRE family transcriptional regulator [Paenibacillus psychroresistens]|uniref:XRE family transcriptional regulator n=1 Tax=Paenibacillus psychroresistens TaxID=1778678 RepID=A0A6B8RM77_9BACL|nr:helix-turn-helix transcriptional regulator [Paenibacillus psychroresistens]QGQ96762.1 XRE family transcriptional regulator [Paenibacillus psychroresistens]